MPNKHPIYDRPIGVFAILAAVIVLGALLIPSLPVDIMPSFRSSAFFVRGNVESATAKETLEDVTRPLEGLVRGISGVDSVFTRTGDGNVFSVISPNDLVDKQDLITQVGEVLDASSHRFPEDFTYTVGSWNNDDKPPVAFALGSGSMDPGDFEELINQRIIPSLSRIEGVVAVSQGDLDPGQVQVYLERNRIAAGDVNPQALADQLRSLESASVVHASDAATQEKQTVLHLKLDDGDSARLTHMPIGDGLSLGDVALLHRTVAGSERVVLVNGKPGVVLEIHRSPEANGYRVSQQAEAVMQRLTAEHNLPFIVPTATHRTIDAATTELIDSGIWGAVSALFFLLLFLRKVRLTLLVCLAIPGSLALAIIGLAASSNPVNIFTMVGFLLALGMLVDNSVVVGEALNRAPQSLDRATRRRLRHRAAQQVSMAILLSTLTTIAIILPFQFLDTGMLSRPVNALAQPLMWSLVGSLAMALIITPILFDWWHKGPSRAKSTGPQWLRLVEGLYGRLLVILYRQPAIALALVLAMISIPIGLMLSNPSGFSVNAQLETDERRAELPIQNRNNASLKRQQEVAEDWYAELEPHLEELGATGVVTKLGGGRGSNRIEIYLKPIDDGLTSDDVADRVADILSPHLDLALQAHFDRARGQAASSGSNRWNRRRGNNGGDTSTLRFNLRYAHADGIGDIWNTIRPHVEALPGVVRVSPPIDPPEPEMELAVLPQALDAGYEPIRIRRQLGRMTTRRSIATLDDGTLLTMGPLGSTTPTLGELQAMTVRGDDQQARVDSVTQMGSVVGSKNIQRRDGMSEVRVNVTVEKAQRAVILDQLTNPQFAQSIGINEQVSFGLNWWQQSAEKSQTAMLTAVVLAVLIVFLLMAFFYESFIAPLAALSSVPLAIVGVLAYLGLSGKEIGAMVLIGCFFLVGIVVNNGIVLVDHLRRRVAPTRCRSDLRVARALAGASRRRLAPILLTSLTTICATLPMAIGSGRIAGLPINELGATVAAGLVSATVFTLFIVPLSYYWLGRIRSRLSR